LLTQTRLQYSPPDDSKEDSNEDFYSTNFSEQNPEALQAATTTTAAPGSILVTATGGSSNIRKRRSIPGTTTARHAKKRLAQTKIRLNCRVYTTKNFTTNKRTKSTVGWIQGQFSCVWNSHQRCFKQRLNCYI
jgi:hypothetical protein